MNQLDKLLSDLKAIAEDYEFDAELTCRRIDERLLAAGYRRDSGDNIQLVMDRDEHRPAENADDLETCSIIASGYEMNCPECGDFTGVGSSIKSIPGVVRCGVCGEWFKAGTAEHCDG